MGEINLKYSFVAHLDDKKLKPNKKIQLEPETLSDEIEIKPSARVIAIKMLWTVKASQKSSAGLHIAATLKIKITNKRFIVDERKRLIVAHAGCELDHPAGA